MPNKYYYFTASLQTLIFGEKAPISVEDFLIDAHRLLAEKDFIQVQAIIEGSSQISGSKLFDQWNSFNHQLCNQLVVARAKEVKQDSNKYTRGDVVEESALAALIDQAMKEENPVKAEQLLDRARWQFLDDYTNQSYFDFDIVLAYAIKLTILTRYEAIASEQGREIFQEYKNFDAVSRALNAN